MVLFLGDISPTPSSAHGAHEVTKNLHSFFLQPGFL